MSTARERPPSTSPAADFDRWGSVDDQQAGPTTSHTKTAPTRNWVLKMDRPLSGKVAVVTGASSGIGLATAQALADDGALLVVAARSTEKLEQVVHDLEGAATAIRTDVTSTRDVNDLVDKTIDLHGRIDILIANAGTYVGGDFVANDVTQLLRLIDTNVGGVIRVIHAALKYMTASGTGDIVVTSSVSGHQSIHWEPVYSASKHAVQALTHGLRRQLIGTGVRIGAVAPGVVLNDLWQVTDAAAVAEGVAAGTGLTSEDVANAVLYMLTMPRHINIRDLVMLPINQEI
jgi:ribitol 2-dehydrogenase